MLVAGGLRATPDNTPIAIIVPAVLDPFPYVAVDTVQTPGIGREVIDADGSLTPVTLGPARIG